MPTKRKSRVVNGPGTSPTVQGEKGLHQRNQGQSHHQHPHGATQSDRATHNEGKQDRHQMTSVTPGKDTSQKTTSNRATLNAAQQVRGTQNNGPTHKNKMRNNAPGGSQKGSPSKDSAHNAPNKTKVKDPRVAMVTQVQTQHSLFTKWLILCVIDLIVNSATCGHIDLGTDLGLSGQVDLGVDLDLGLSREWVVTYVQLWWCGVVRMVLLVHLWYHVHRRYTQGVGTAQDTSVTTSGLRHTCYIHLCVTPVFCCHLVARLLLDSESTHSDPINPGTASTSGTSAGYCWLLVWHAVCTLTQAWVTWRCLSSCPGGDRPAGEERDKKGRLVPGTEVVGQATLYKLYVWYRPHLPFIVLGYVLLIIHATVDAMLPYYKAKVIDVIKSDSPLEGLSQHVVGMVLLSLIGTLTTTLWSSVTMRVCSGLHFRIRGRLFRWIIYQEMAFFDKTKSGELTSSLASDAEALGGVLSRLDSVIKTTTRIIGMIFFMARLSWQLTLVVVMGNAVLVVATHFYGKYTKSIHKKSQECRRAANVIAQEVISSMRTVRAFGSEEEEITRYTEKCREQYNLQLTEAWLSPSYTAVDQMLHMTLMASTIFYGGHLVVKERISSGDLVSFILYLTKLGAAMSSLLNVHQWLMRMLGASEKVFKYLDADPVAPYDGTEAPEQLEGKIQLKDVTFAYPTRPDVNVLKNLTLSVAPGEVVALVGPSGAGKSSVFNLLQRFYQPLSGHVTLDSRPLLDYKHTYLRSKMAIVSQEPTLFARSIQENISYGLSPDGVTPDGVMSAAKAANAAAFIERFPDGMDTYVGEKGQQLSGGQKQRVAIARALIRNPTVLLLDEATSALDTESEKQVQEALHRTVGGRTVVIIAHRLSTVRRADRILVINRGTIVEEGTHQHLLQKQGLYYNLVKCQLLRGIT